MRISAKVHSPARNGRGGVALFAERIDSQHLVGGGSLDYYNFAVGCDTVELAVYPYW